MNSSSKNDERIWARRDRTISPPQRAFSRGMRKAPTDAERKLWWHLRHRLPLAGTHFRRQVQIGPYIVDFACHHSKLAIEIDGSQHGSEVVKDQQRTDCLQAEGYRVLRFWNNDVLSNVDGVLTAILHALTMTPTPDPSPQGGGEKKVPRPPRRFAGGGEPRGTGDQ